MLNLKFCFHYHSFGDSRGAKMTDLFMLWEIFFFNLIYKIANASQKSTALCMCITIFQNYNTRNQRKPQRNGLQPNRGCIETLTDGKIQKEKCQKLIAYWVSCNDNGGRMLTSQQPVKGHT